MDAKPRTLDECYGPALERARQALPALNPHKTAARAGVAFDPSHRDEGAFAIPFFGQLYRVQWPEGTVWRAADRQRADIVTHILLLHYLARADGTPMASKWIAFRSLPGGLGYEAAFEGRANQRLAREFGSNQSAFVAAARALGGESLTFGDASFLFRTLPHLWLATILYLADDEFPASAQVLFDASASHYLPTEDIAVLGGLLASRLIKAAPG
jgi:hypothetical protein